MKIKLEMRIKPVPIAMLAMDSCLATNRKMTRVAKLLKTKTFEAAAKGRYRSLTVIVRTYEPGISSGRTLEELLFSS